MSDFFNSNLQTRDLSIYSSIQKELNRQKNSIELIASENIVSKAVLEAQGSILTNKYAEGYPSKRYYGGCEFVDEVEEIAKERARKLFKCEYVNVQPHSGASANHAVFFAFLKPGDTILGMNITCGGHLTHGAMKTESGSWFNAITYGVEKETGLINYDEVRDLAIRNKPKLIICGASSYSRIIKWNVFREIADECGAVLMADIAHYAGLIVSELYPSPVEYADVVTTTTHKTLRGPRGGMILAKSLENEKVLNSAVFPGTQGGPLMHVIAAKSVAFGEALTEEFKLYSRNVLDNSRYFAQKIMDNGFNIVSNGTDSHMFTIDLRKSNVTGKIAEKALDSVGITCNKNMIPFDPETPFVTSGLRVGTPACTTRGFQIEDFSKIAELITKVINNIKLENSINFENEIAEYIKSEVGILCNKFPIY